MSKQFNRFLGDWETWKFVMARFCLLLMLLLSVTMVQARDVIVLKNGEVINCYNVEQGRSSVFYTETDSPDAPILKIHADSVFSIKPENGEMRTVGKDSILPPADNNSGSGKDTKTPSGFVPKEPAENNVELISRYNRTHLTAFKEWSYEDYLGWSEDNADDAYGFYAVEPGSVLSTEDIEIEISRHSDCFNIGSRYVKIKNKTNNVIYVDLANTFKVFDDGRYRSYYDATQTTTSSGSDSGVGFNLGAAANAFGIGGITGSLLSGVTVGGGSNSSISTTVIKERVLSIPSQGVAVLPYMEDFSCELIPDMAVKKGESVSDIKVGGDIYSIRYRVMYSLRPDFTTWSTVEFSLYLSELIGNGSSFWNVISRDDKYTICGYIKFK